MVFTRCATNVQTTGIKQSTDAMRQVLGEDDVSREVKY